MAKYPFLFLFGFLFACSSSDAPAPPSNPIGSVSIGTVETIYSEALGEDREVWIHVPQGFYNMNEQVEEYPVIYLMDGDIHFTTTVGILEQTSSAANAIDLTPQAIVVGIPNVNRTYDLTPTPAVIGSDSSTLNNTGGAGKMAEFLTQELIPYVDAKFLTAPYRTLIGHSFGGLFVINTLLEHPEDFTNYLIMDPSMWWDEDRYAQEVINRLPNLPLEGKSVFLSIADNKLPSMSLADLSADTSEVFGLMRSLLNFSAAISEMDLPWNLKVEYYEGKTHGQIPLPSTIDGFNFFFNNHPFRRELEFYISEENLGDQDFAPLLKAHFARLSEEMGYTIRPTESYVNAYAFGLMQFDKLATASGLFDLNIEYYPRSANALAAKGFFLLNQGDTLGAIQQFESSMILEELPHVVSTLEELQN